MAFLMTGNFLTEADEQQVLATAAQLSRAHDVDDEESDDGDGLGRNGDSEAMEDV